jgi:hypothetical protein
MDGAASKLPAHRVAQATRGAIAQLGERLDRTQEVAGSSPASSITRSLADAGLSVSTLAAELEQQLSGWRNASRLASNSSWVQRFARAT